VSVHIAVDIGGTHMRAAIYTADSLQPLNRLRITTYSPGKTPLLRLHELISSIWPKDDHVDGIGVVAPGPINSRKGILLAAPNIPEWKNMALQKGLEELFNVPVALGNDANLAALGEWKYGVGRDHHYVVYLTISTGIGSGIIVDDQLLEGASGLGAELGHITVLPDGPLCGCGQRGHLEALASGTAISHWVGEKIHEGVPTSLPADQKLTARDVSIAAREGDRLANEAFERAGTFIGLALADFLHIFNPTIVIFGGGVSQSGSLLLNPVLNELRRRIMSPYYLENLTITNAALGDDAGLFGALALVRKVTSGVSA
jgi:glucokinase